MKSKNFNLLGFQPIAGARDFLSVNSLLKIDEKLQLRPAVVSKAFELMSGVVKTNNVFLSTFIDKKKLLCYYSLTDKPEKSYMFSPATIEFRLMMMIAHLLNDKTSTVPLYNLVTACNSNDGKTPVDASFIAVAGEASGAEALNSISQSINDVLSGFAKNLNMVEAKDLESQVSSIVQNFSNVFTTERLNPKHYIDERCLAIAFLGSYLKLLKGTISTPSVDIRGMRPASFAAAAKVTFKKNLIGEDALNHLFEVYEKDTREQAFNAMCGISDSLCVKDLLTFNQRTGQFDLSDEVFAKFLDFFFSDFIFALVSAEQEIFKVRYYLPRVADYLYRKTVEATLKEQVLDQKYRALLSIKIPYGPVTDDVNLVVDIKESDQKDFERSLAYDATFMEPVIDKLYQTLTKYYTPINGLEFQASQIFLTYENGRHNIVRVEGLATDMPSSFKIAACINSKNKRNRPTVIKYDEAPLAVATTKFDKIVEMNSVYPEFSTLGASSDESPAYGVPFVNFDREKLLNSLCAYGTILRCTVDDETALTISAKLETCRFLTTIYPPKNGPNNVVSFGSNNGGRREVLGEQFECRKITLANASLPDLFFTFTAVETAKLTSEQLAALYVGRFGQFTKNSPMVPFVYAQTREVVGYDAGLSWFLFGDNSARWCNLTGLINGAKPADRQYLVPHGVNLGVATKNRLPKYARLKQAASFTLMLPKRILSSVGSRMLTRYHVFSGVRGKFQDPYVTIIDSAAIKSLKKNGESVLTYAGLDGKTYTLDKISEKQVNYAQENDYFFLVLNLPWSDLLANSALIRTNYLSADELTIWIDYHDSAINSLNRSVDLFVLKDGDIIPEGSLFTSLDFSNCDQPIEAVMRYLHEFLVFLVLKSADHYNTLDVPFSDMQKYLIHANTFIGKCVNLLNERYADGLPLNVLYKSSYSTVGEFRKSLETLLTKIGELKLPRENATAWTDDDKVILSAVFKNVEELIKRLDRLSRFDLIGAYSLTTAADFRDFEAVTFEELIGGIISKLPKPTFIEIPAIPDLSTMLIPSVVSPILKRVEEFASKQASIVVDLDD